MGDKIDKTVLDVGHVINEQWRILAILGEGNCSRVYKVWDLKRKMKAALKTESDQLDILKKEYDVFKKLEVRKHVPRVFHAGKRDFYSYIVMTLCGKNLIDLKKDCKLELFTPGTMARVGIHALYGIKQVHEIGYVHRDIKPANMVIGRGRGEDRVIYVIDYGMARRYATWENGKPRHRAAREGCLFRGSYRYCSPFCHERKEQARRDDMFSYIYSLIFLLKGSLPWNGMQPDEIAELKKTIKDDELLEKCPQEWFKILTHIKNLQYDQRPDYKFIYEQLKASMDRVKVTFASPYDWENANKSNKTQSCSAAASLEGYDSHKEANHKEKPLEPLKVAKGSQQKERKSIKTTAKSPGGTTASSPKSDVVNPKKVKTAPNIATSKENVGAKNPSKEVVVPGKTPSKEVVAKPPAKDAEKPAAAAKKDAPANKDAKGQTQKKSTSKKKKKEVVVDPEKTDKTETFEEGAVRQQNYPTVRADNFASNDIGI